MMAWKTNYFPFGGPVQKLFIGKLSNFGEIFSKTPEVRISYPMQEACGGCDVRGGSQEATSGRGNFWKGSTTLEQDWRHGEKNGKLSVWGHNKDLNKGPSGWILIFHQPGFDWNNPKELGIRFWGDVDMTSWWTSTSGRNAMFSEVPLHLAMTLPPMSHNLVERMLLSTTISNLGKPTWKSVSWMILN